MPLSSSSAISRWEQVNFQWDDDEVLFVLDQYCVLSGEAEYLIFVTQSQKKLHHKSFFLIYSI